MKAHRGALTLVLAVAALAGTACGSSDKSAQPITVADWAGGVCSAITTYKTSLTDAATSVKSSLSKTGLQDAADAAKTATDTFVADVKGLGKPVTTSGQLAKDTVDTLSTQVKEDAAAIEAAAQKGGLQAVSDITGSLATAQTQLKASFTTLKGLDAKGELSDAFATAPTCAPLNGS